MTQNTIDAANGRWREILPALGVAEIFLNGRHQPCPLCGGKDRARFTDNEGIGSYFCNQCGSGTGMQLLMKLHGWDFARAAREVDRIIGNLPTEKPVAKKKRAVTDADLNRLWHSASMVAANDPVGKYLAMRGLDRMWVTTLRFAHLSHRNGNLYPAMLSKFCDTAGNGKQIHRTFLTEDGRKADVTPNRMFMPCEIPRGGAIRLGDPAETMGVAEGIETALSASKLYGMPVWAVTSEHMLQVFEPPIGVKRLIVFGDNDENFVGQCAAYLLGKRLTLDGNARGLERVIDVKIPEVAGQDWNDVLLGEIDARTTH